MGILGQLRDSPGMLQRDPKDAPPPRLPAVFQRSAHPALRVLLPVTMVAPLPILAVIMLMPGASGVSLAAELSAGVPWLLPVLFLVLLMETAVLLWVLASVLRTRSYTVDRLMVACDSRSPFGSESWRESVGSYTAISLLRQRQKGGTLYVVQMRHPDPARTVPLYIAEDQEAAFRQQALWSAMLRLPAEPAT